MTVKLSVDNQAAVEEVTARLAAFQRTFNDLSIAWFTIGAKVRDHIDERWINHRDSFAPLAESTVIARRRALTRQTQNKMTKALSARLRRAAAQLDKDGDDAGAHSARLSASTARLHNLAGYYQRNKPGSLGYSMWGSDAFWWTGRAMARATSDTAFHATSTSLIYDFGRQSDARRRLEWMHFGSSKRPARPIYDIDAVAEIADEWLNKFVDQQLQAANLGKAGFARS